MEVVAAKLILYFGLGQMDCIAAFSRTAATCGLGILYVLAGLGGPRRNLRWVCSLAVALTTTGAGWNLGWQLFGRVRMSTMHLAIYPRGTRLMCLSEVLIDTPIDLFRCL